MKVVHRFGLLVLPWVVWGLSAGCAGDKTQNKDSSDSQVVAQAVGVDIAAPRIERALTLLYPDEALRPEAVERKVLQRIIDVELLVAAAVERGLENDIKVKQEVAEIRQELLLEELYRRGILKFTSQVSAEEVRQYFDRHHIGQQRRFRRILVAGLKQAGGVMLRLGDGESFAALAVEVSDDGTTAQEGGDLGWQSRLYFKNHVLRRQVFNAELGAVVGPFREPDGYSLLKVEAERQTDLASMAAEVEEAVRQQKQSLTTMKYLEDLADDFAVEEEEESFELLLKRLGEAGEGLPQLRSAEGRRVLLRQGEAVWNLDQFVKAMVSERDQAEIKDLRDLRLYARRLYALKRLLPKRAEELGLDQTEHVKVNLEKVRRDALVDRLRRIEVDELIDPSDAEVKAYYQKNQERYRRQERVSILEILVAERDEAVEIRRQIDAGADIAELAERHSVRSARVRRAGGRIQLMSPDKYGRIGEEAYNAKIGDVVGPLKTSQGYSVFQVTKRVPGEQYSYARSEFRVRSHLRQDWVSQRFEEYLEKLRQRYANRVSINEERLAALGAGG
jgi:parvulin-like peptidyl-prolyl isomerase